MANSNQQQTLITQATVQLAVLDNSENINPLFIVNKENES